MAGKMTHLLWAEDNARDRLFIEESLATMASPPARTVVADGVLLLQALEKNVPNLVVLDLKMPRLGGLDVLRRLRTDSRWKALPVVIFSSGNRPDEIAQCLDLGVVEVIQKSVDFDRFSADVQRIAQAIHP